MIQGQFRQTSLSAQEKKLHYNRCITTSLTHAYALRRAQAKVLLFVMIFQTIGMAVSNLVAVQPEELQSYPTINDHEVLLDPQDLNAILTSNQPLVYLGKNSKALLATIVSEPLGSMIPVSRLPLDLIDVLNITPITVVISNDQIKNSVTTMLYQCDDAQLPPSVQYEGFTIAFQPSKPYDSKPINISPEIYIDPQLDLFGEMRAFNDSYIKINSDKNANIRITGSSDFLGIITAPGLVSGSLSASSKPLAIDPSTGQIGIGNSSNSTFTSDVFVQQGKTLFVSEIDPRSPTTTTTFSGSISLPNSTTANNGSLQMNGVPFLTNFGTNNTFAGANAGNLTMSGVANTAVGSGAFQQNTTGGSNMAVGVGALASNTIGSANIAVGPDALLVNTTGDNNIALGFQALESNISGGSNVAIAVSTMLNNISGSNNVAIGESSLRINTSGSQNTALGFGAMESNTTGALSTALGYQALRDFRIGATGNHTVLGANVLSMLITGTANTAIGVTSASVPAGFSLFAGSDNIYICNPGSAQESQMIYLGTNATHTGCLIQGINGVTVSTGSLVYVDASGRLGTETSSTTFNNDVTIAQGNTLFVSEIDPVSPTTTTTFSGSISLPNSTTANHASLQINGLPFLSNFGNRNTFLGGTAGNLTMSGGYNTAIGTGTLNNNTTAGGNTALGVQALQYNTTGFQNTASGLRALQYNTTGFYNTASGVGALLHNTTASYNTAFGMNALNFNTTGGANTASGHNALFLNTTGVNNAAFGHVALQSFRIGSTGNHTAVGAFVLSNLVTGTGNTGIGLTSSGAAAGQALFEGSDNIYICNLGSAQESQMIRLGNIVTHTGCLIQGIYGVTVDPTTQMPALIDASGRLGTIVSSRRFKDDIQDMGQESADILKLRPVTFTYKKDATKTKKFGLIAEEVKQVFPSIVVNDADGQPFTVQYQELPSLLLNELIRQDGVIQDHTVTIEDLKAKLASVGAMNAHYFSVIESMNARLAVLEASAAA